MRNIDARYLNPLNSRSCELAAMTVAWLKVVVYVSTCNEIDLSSLKKKDNNNGKQKCWILELESELEKETSDNFHFVKVKPTGSVCISWSSV